MALVLYDRVQQTGTAITTVSFTLSATPAGYQSFAVVGNGNTTYYSSFDSSGNWEVGIGTYVTGGTLTRTTILSSSNTGSAVTFSGTVTVFISYPASKSVNLDASSNVSPLGTVASGTWNATTVAPAYGGTGQSTYTDGQLLIGNSTGNTLAKSTLTAGTGVTITNGSGAITVAAPLAKQIDVYTSGTGVTWTAPANTQWVKITAVGKGGNGGGTTSQRGSGGGAGGIAIKGVPITAGQTLIFTVNATSFPNFVTSGTYTLAQDVTAYGGTDGTSVAYAASFTAGGLGGSAAGGDINIPGGYGGSAFGTSTAVGTQQSGFGGSNMFGVGGYAVGIAINAGINGRGYGSGGGGSVGSTTVGLGQNGAIIFESY